jgi:hypothetical protein
MSFNIRERIENMKQTLPNKVEEGKKIIEELVKQYPFLKQPELMTKMLYVYLKYGNSFLESIQRPLELKPTIASETMKFMWVNGAVESFLKKEGMLKKVGVIYLGQINETKQIEDNGMKRKIRNFTAIIDKRVHVIIISGVQIEKYNVKVGKVYEMSLAQSNGGSYYAVDNPIINELNEEINWNEVAETLLTSYPKLKPPFDLAVSTKRDYVVMGLINKLNPKFGLIKFMDESNMEYTIGIPKPADILRDGDPIIVIGSIIKANPSGGGQNQQIQLDYVMLAKIAIDLNFPLNATTNINPIVTSETSNMTEAEVKSLFGGINGA